DLVLGVVALDLDRQRDLLELAGEGALVGEEQVAGELLGDRAAALGAAQVHEIGYGGPPDAPQIDAPVLIEAAVLGGDRGVDQVARNLSPRTLGRVLFEATVPELPARR